MLHTPFKRPPLKPLLLCTACVLLAATACTTYRTEADAERDDRSFSRSGDLPYFLPKGFIRLRVRPVGGGAVAGLAQGGISNSGTGSAVNVAPIINNTLPAPAPAPTNNNDKPRDEAKEAYDLWMTALEGLTDYEIEMTAVLRPDKTSRRFAHYIPNWLYQESIGLDSDGDHLLKTTESTLTDRTRESLSNLAETFAQSLIALDGFATLRRNSFSFFAPPAPGVALEDVKKKPLQPTFAVRKVDVDITFDPTDAKAVERVKSLFNPENGKHWKVGNVELVSPFLIELPTAGETKATSDAVVRGFNSKKSGLWFRAPKTYRARVKSNLPAIMSRLQKLPPTPEFEMPLTVALGVAKKYTARDRDLEVAIPDPDREFEWNVQRSAFIEKKVKLVVNQGVLQGFSLTKGSEVEGFTTIPLALARQAASVPRALVDNRSSLTTGLNTLNANERTLDNRETAARQAQLKAEQDLLDQQIATEKKRRELQQLLESNATSPTPAP